MSGLLLVKRLSVLVQRYVEGISGAGYTRFSLDESDLVVEKRYAASVERESSARVAGLDAHVATIAVKNIDQLRMDPRTVGSKVEVVFVHMPFRYQRESPRHGEAEFPVLMMAAYYNRASEFEEGLADFHDFLNRISVDGKTGAAMDHAAGEPSNEGVSRQGEELESSPDGADARLPENADREKSSEADEPAPGEAVP